MITTNKGLADIAGIGGGNVFCTPALEMQFLKELVEEYAPDEAFNENGIDWSLISLETSPRIIIYSFKGVDFLVVDYPIAKVKRKKGKYILRAEIKFMAVG